MMGKPARPARMEVYGCLRAAFHQKKQLKQTFRVKFVHTSVLWVGLPYTNQFKGVYVTELRPQLWSEFMYGCCIQPGARALCGLRKNVNVTIDAVVIITTLAALHGSACIWQIDIVYLVFNEYVTGLNTV